MAITYEYRYSTDADDLVNVVWTVADSPTEPITGLESGTTYAFQTRAKDEAGNYSEPTAIFYETTAGVPSEPPLSGAYMVSFGGSAVTSSGEAVSASM